MNKKGWISLIIAGVVIAILAIILVNNMVASRNKLSTYEQNYIAAMDSLRKYELENGELLAAKSMYVLERDQLLEKIGSDSKTIAEIESKLNSTSSMLASVETEVRVDTIYTAINEITRSDSMVYIKFNYYDDYLDLIGNVFTSQDSTSVNIDRLSVPVSLVIGTTQDNQFFVETENPYIDVINIISGKVSTKNKSRWSIGIHAGFGFQYGLSSGEFDYGPTLGFGVQYRLF